MNSNSYGYEAKPPIPARAAISPADELTKLRRTRDEIQRMWFSTQHELELTKRMRVEAEKYRQEMETRARSQLHMLTLQTRQTLKKELAELRCGLKEEIEKIIADILITAREGLETQRRFTDAARICAISPAFQEEVAQRAESAKEAINV